MQRREFLKAGCSLCVVLGSGIMISSLSSYSSLPVYRTVVSENKIIVPRSLFDKTELQIIRPKNFEYDIALRKEKDETFMALLLRCTHSDNQLLSSGNSFECTLHGSKFDEQGKVVKGPAQNALKKYITVVSSSEIIINLT